MKMIWKLGLILILTVVLSLGQSIPSDVNTTTRSSTKEDTDKTQTITSQRANQSPQLGTHPLKLNAAERAAKEAKGAEVLKRKKQHDIEISRLDLVADSARSKMIQDFEQRKLEKEKNRSPSQHGKPLRRK